MHRRDFLKACAATGALLQPAIGQLVFAESLVAPTSPQSSKSPPPLLVVVFLRGGCDGLNLAAPVNEQAYIDARPPELRLLDNGERAGLPLANGLEKDLDFRLHPEAAPLHALYNAGLMTVIHACGLPSGTRSHFEAQDLIEQGIGRREDASQARDGWLTRYLNGLQLGHEEKLAAISAGNGIPLALRGWNDALALPNLQDGLALPGGKDASAVLHRLYSGDNSIHLAGRRALDKLTLIDTRLPRGNNGRVAPYPSLEGKTYDNNNFALGLQTIGRMARMELGLHIATIDHGGWDTHEGQPGRFANQVRELSRALATFHEDMARAGRPVRVVVLTEFGRRLRANRSMGTDHGHGSVMLALGDGIQGGRMAGHWPSLDTPQLDQGVDLAATTDIRAVLAETLGIDTTLRRTVFPGLQLSAALGIVAKTNS